MQYISAFDGTGRSCTACKSVVHTGRPVDQCPSCCTITQTEEMWRGRKEILDDGKYGNRTIVNDDEERWNKKDSLFAVGVCVCVCVCERERERELRDPGGRLFRDSSIYRTARVTPSNRGGRAFFFLAFS